MLIVQTWQSTQTSWQLRLKSSTHQSLGFFPAGKIGKICIEKENSLPRLLCKLPGTEEDPNSREVPWHQDSQYWPLEPMKVKTDKLTTDTFSQVVLAPWSDEDCKSQSLETTLISMIGGIIDLPLSIVGGDTVACSGRCHWRERGHGHVHFLCCTRGPSFILLQKLVSNSTDWVSFSREDKACQKSCCKRKCPQNSSSRSPFLKAFKNQGQIEFSWLNPLFPDGSSCPGCPAHREGF